MSTTCASKSVKPRFALAAEAPGSLTDRWGPRRVWQPMSGEPVDAEGGRRIREKHPAPVQQI